MYIGPALQGANLISRVGIPLLQQAGIGAGIAGLGALAERVTKGAQKSSDELGRKTGMYGKYGAPETQERSWLYSTTPQPAATFASTGSQIERAYQDEKARVAQLSEQDPLFKKYRVAELTKAYNAAKGDEKERLGLEIWATTNPQLAQKLKPGQLGYTEATSAFQAASPLGSFKQATGGMEFANKMSELGPEAASFAFSPEGLKTPLTGIQIPPTQQVGVEEMAKTFSQPIPGAMEAFTNPLQFFKPDLTQTQQALIRRAFEQRLK